MYIGLQVLRAKIRGFQSAGETIHKRIFGSKGPKRDRLWCEKRLLGNYNREHLIAYGLLRGVPYERIEKCAKTNKPNVQRVFELIQAHGDGKAKREFTLDLVKTLLEGTTTPNHVVGSIVVSTEPTSSPVKRRQLNTERLLKAIPLITKKPM